MDRFWNDLRLGSRILSFAASTMLPCTPHDLNEASRLGLHLAWMALQSKMSKKWPVSLGRHTPFIVDPLAAFFGHVGQMEFPFRKEGVLIPPRSVH